MRRGQLGVVIGDVTQDIAEAMGLDKVQGVLVSEVMKDSGADAAGIEPGDVIVSLDGEVVTGVVDLRARVGLGAIGDKVAIGIVRDGERETLEATIGQAGTAGLARSDDTHASGLAGVTLRDLDPAHPLHGRVRGVEVVEAMPYSQAWEAGLRAGDVILAVNRRAVAGVAEFENAVAGARSLGLLIQRGDRRLFAMVR